ncbi:MAG: pilin [Mycobacteriales bacterium]
MIRKPLILLLLGALAAAVALAAATPVSAHPLVLFAAAAPPAPPTLAGVIDGLRLWLVGLLATLATFFLTLGGVRYLTAAGDPGQVEKAKTALKSAAIGYALAALAPLLVGVLQSLVAG